MPSKISRGVAAIVLAVICAAAAGKSEAADREAAGKAVVVVGHASVGNADGRHALASGASVSEGDTIETGADGYVYVTTVDHGFISLRPNSSLSIEHFEYDANAPANTVIKLMLNHGVVREISGKGAQAARDHYRMNTPVAALGVRGTDFTVFTNANVTTASVRSGGIVMTPLGEGCAASGAGPCEGSNAEQLFANLKEKALQFTRGSIRPVLMDTRLTPLTTEPGGSGQKSEDSAARAAMSVTHVDQGVVDPTQLTFSPPAGSTPSAPPPAATPEAQQIFWGRFNPIASLPATTSLADLLTLGSELVGTESGAFAIVRTPQTNMVMPVQGSFNFGLQSNSEAWLVNASTGIATAAAITNGALNINFGTGTFTTNLQLNANGTPYAVSGFGGVSNNGKLFSDLLSPARIIGGLAGSNATQAGYAFSQQVGTNQSLTGATLWSR